MKAGRTTVIFALAAAVVAACQTGPTRPLMSPFDEREDFGYSERRLSDQRYEVSYQGPNKRTWVDRERRGEDIEEARGLTYDLALWHAAELTSENGFAAFTVEDRRSEIVVEIIEDAPYPFYGYTDYTHGFHHLGGHHFYAYPAPILRSAWLQARVSLTVDMMAEAAEGAFDAEATAERLKAKHAGALVLPEY